MTEYDTWSKSTGSAVASRYPGNWENPALFSLIFSRAKR